jgi:hypothetical protein
MPQMADIIVKKNDGATNITYSALNPSGGDASQALWRAPSTIGAVTAKPEFVMSSTWNGPKTARKPVAKLTYPYAFQDPTTGKITSTDKAIINLDAVIPVGMLDTDIAEAVSQAVNLFASQLIKDSVKAGFAPT